MGAVGSIFGELYTYVPTTLDFPGLKAKLANEEGFDELSENIGQLKMPSAAGRTLLPSLQTTQATSSSYQNGSPLPPVTAGGGTFPMSN